MKKVIGTTMRREGRNGDRKYQVIECQNCGAITYERRQKRVEAALSRGCMSCKGIAHEEAEAALQLQKQKDKALIDSHRAINKLHQRLKPDKRVKHGLSRSDTRRTYCIWRNMIDRCYNPNNDSFNHYGGRGITVCDRWHDVSNFIEDMGIAPDGYSIERHDVNGNYEPFNCSWIPKCEQAGNRRNCLTNRGIEDAKAHWKDYRKQRARDRKGHPASMPHGHCYTYKSPENAWWRAANRPDIRLRLYGPLQYAALYALRTK